MTTSERSEELHRINRGKIATALKVSLDTKENLSLAYTPGVGHISTLIASDGSLANVYTNKGNTVAIVSDGSAVLGLGNIGPLAALPVMEGKAALFKRFGGVDAVPIVLDTQDTEKIIESVLAIAPSFGGINLEDIAAPQCFEIEKKLREKLSIPVFHDDQHGTAIVVLAGLMNALSLRGISIGEARIVINGAGAAGHAIFELLWEAGARNIVVLDSKGTLNISRTDLNTYKLDIAQKTMPTVETFGEAIQGANVLIGVSSAGAFTKEHVASMDERPIVFAMANPIPEIMPEEALSAGAYIVATGRSDFPNQINNALVFPGLFRGALDTKTTHISTKHMIAAAHAIASLVEVPTREEIIPNIFNERLVGAIAEVFR